MSVPTKRVALTVAAILIMGATLRFQRIVVDVPGNEEPERTWRVLWPGQCARVEIKGDGKLMTDEYVAYGLLWFSGRVFERETDFEE